MRVNRSSGIGQAHAARECRSRAGPSRRSRRRHRRPAALAGRARSRSGGTARSRDLRPDERQRAVVEQRRARRSCRRSRRPPSQTLRSACSMLRSCRSERLRLAEQLPVARGAGSRRSARAGVFGQVEREPADQLRRCVVELDRGREALAGERRLRSRRETRSSAAAGRRFRPSLTRSGSPGQRVDLVPRLGGLLLQRLRMVHAPRRRSACSISSRVARSAKKLING